MKERIEITLGFLSIIPLTAVFGWILGVLVRLAVWAFLIGYNLF